MKRKYIYALLALLGLSETVLALDGELGNLSKASTQISITVPETITVTQKYTLGELSLVPTKSSCSFNNPQACVTVRKNLPSDSERISVLRSNHETLVLIIEPRI